MRGRFREIAEKLRKAFEPGSLRIILRKGRLVVQLPNDILFDSGKTILKPEGQDSLRKLAGVLKTIPQRTFIIAGHTDNVPVKQKNPKFESNWELSTLRGLAALRFLESEGVAPAQLVGAGYGEYLPQDTNDTEEGRAKNRRTEVIFMPTVDEIPQLPATI